MKIRYKTDKKTKKKKTTKEFEVEFSLRSKGSKVFVDVVVWLSGLAPFISDTIQWWLS